MIYLDPYQGASGDMLVGALLDLEEEKSGFLKEVGNLCSGKVTVSAEKSVHESITGTRIKFTSEEEKHIHRSFDDIKAVIGKLPLEDAVRSKVLETYDLIFEAESRIHDKPQDKIRLHELSSLETLFEITSFFMLLKEEKIYCRNITLGSGIKESAHGIIPIPSPATSEILKDVPIKFKDTSNEMVTPTAAALLKVAADFVVPDMRIEKIGYGLGSRSVLRVFEASNIFESAQNLLQIQVNIDDMTSEDIRALIDKLLRTARDVYVNPVIMKKGRPGFILTVLCEEKNLSTVKESILKESSTAGLRYWQVAREALQRKIIDFDSSYGRCRVKELIFADGSKKIKIEFEDLLRLSETAQVSISDLRDKIRKEYLDE